MCKITLIQYCIAFGFFLHRAGFLCRNFLRSIHRSCGENVLSLCLKRSVAFAASDSFDSRPFAWLGLVTRATLAIGKGMCRPSGLGIASLADTRSNGVQKTAPEKVERKKGCCGLGLLLLMARDRGYTVFVLFGHETMHKHLQLHCSRGNGCLASNRRVVNFE